MHDGTAFPHEMRIPGHEVFEIQARLSPCLQLIFLQITVTAEFCEMLLFYKLLIYCQTWPGTCFIVQASHDLMVLWLQSIGVYHTPGLVFVCGLIFSKLLASWQLHG